MDGTLYALQLPDGTAMTFSYDKEGEVYGFTYNGSNYYYLQNIQGDIVGIVDNSGTSVVSYTYDAWGNPLSISGTLADTVGTYNPFRYRGYIYDTETGLYYLQSRYYDPQTGRFVNADGQINADSLQGYNLFAYCYNSPVLLSDSNGARPVVGASPQKETEEERAASFAYMHGKPYIPSETGENELPKDIKTQTLRINHSYTDAFSLEFIVSATSINGEWVSVGTPIVTLKSTYDAEGVTDILGKIIELIPGVSSWHTEHKISKIHYLYAVCEDADTIRIYAKMDVLAYYEILGWIPYELGTQTVTMQVGAFERHIV